MLNSEKNIQKYGGSTDEVKRIILTSKNFNKSDDFKKPSMPWILITTTIALIIFLLYKFFYQN